MGNWTRVKKDRAFAGGRAPRTTTAVRRFRTGQKRAYFVIPMNLLAGETAANVYRDGASRLAFDFSDKGDFTLCKSGGSKTTGTILLPDDVCHLVPYGTTDIPHTIDGGLIVIDLDDLPPAVAAE